jgi:hypothetical protein
MGAVARVARLASRGMSRPVAALALLVLAAPACASSGHGSAADDGARPPAVVVPAFTVAPPPPPPAPPPALATPGIEPAANPACTLTANDVSLAHAISLHVEDSAPFFHVDEAKAIEVRLASPRSTARASRSDLEIIGHVQLSELHVRLRSDALVHGYLRVNHATLRDGDPTHLQLVVDTPWFLRPVAEPVVPVACDDIALARDIAHTDALFRGKQVDLRLGAPIAVRATAGGPVVATIELPRRDIDSHVRSVDAHEMERRGAQVRIRIEWEATDVEGWVSGRDVSPHVESDLMMGLLGALGHGGATIALASDAPLHVRTGGRVVRVGTARPGTFECRKPASADAREIELDSEGPFGGWGGLGFGGPGSGPQPAEAKLFVVPGRGEACVERPR